MSYEIIYESTAEEDLWEISSYYSSQGGLELAEKMYLKIINQINKLETMPSRCPKSDYYENSEGETARVLILNKMPYKVFFRVKEAERKVFIISVIHSARQLPN